MHYCTITQSLTLKNGGGDCKMVNVLGTLLPCCHAYPFEQGKQKIGKHPKVAELV